MAFRATVRRGSVIRLLRLFCFAALAGVAAPACAQSVDVPPRLLPQPAHVVAHQGVFRIGPDTPVRVPEGDAGARNAAERFVDLVERTRGLSLRIETSGSGPAIRFRRTDGLPDEGYTLTSSAGGVQLAATGNGGLLYAGVTLWQLMTPEPGSGAAIVPALDIDDAPRFAWRGLMLDSARHFQSPAYVRKLIDWMAANKLNTLHWHLVDDQGWRLQIKRYPKLTAISAWRRPATAPGAPPLPRTGGFYTQDEVRDIVAYAAKRNVTIVPEIEMPGHALSAIRAYPKLGMGVAIPPGTESDWGVFPWLYNVDDDTFTFLENVLSEVMDLFPSRYIHVGGDEAVKGQWEASPRIQAKMKELGIADEDALQGWFVARIGRFLKAHGRKLIGWDEILEGGVPADATVMSWRGIDGAIAAARSGHDTVLSPAPTLYIDNRQGASALEPPGRGNLITLRTVYEFDPLPDRIPAEARGHVLGLQANLWTEHVRTEDRAQWMMFPRASAIAETGWSPAHDHDFRDFVDRLVPQMERMRLLGLHPAISAFAVTATTNYAVDSGEATVTLSQQAGYPIRYTLDGSTPDASSPRYYAPLALVVPAHIRAAAFRGDDALRGALDLPLDAEAVRSRGDDALTPCGSSILLSLEDDAPAEGGRARFVMDVMHPCWLWNAAPVGGARHIAITVGQLPFNFQIGDDVRKIRFDPPTTPAGEMIVRADDCDGPKVATLPLAPATNNPALTRLEAPLASLDGNRTLCVTYTARGVNPLWGVDEIELLP